MSISDLLNRMEAAENAFLHTKFLAPILPGGHVEVRIAGIVCRLRIEGDAAPGWAILRPLALDRAIVVGQPTLRQIRDFLALFPPVRLLALGQVGAQWLALPAQRGDQRFRIATTVPVQLVTGVERFQQLIARFDGRHFWFQEVDRRRNPAIAAYLRQALAAETDPAALHKTTLTAEERDAYRLAFAAIAAARQTRSEQRLAEALAHGGAALVAVLERDDSYTVTYALDGQQHRATVRKDDLTVLVAGICLSGEDERFDLQSLVGVIREGDSRGRIVRVGENADQEWEA